MKKSTGILTADLSAPATNQIRYDATETSLERSLADVLADVVHVEQVPVDAHFFDDLGADSMVMAHFCARVRKREDLPSVSMKDIYQHPTVSSLATALVDAAPVPVGRTLTTTLAEVLAEIVHLDRVPVDAHFFDDLGADSLVMAHFCARVRKRDDLPSVSMKDIYQHPTISSLATALSDTVPAPAVSGSPVPADRWWHRRRHGPAGLRMTSCAGSCSCWSSSGTPTSPRCSSCAGYEWISAGPRVVDIYLRSVISGGALFVSLCTFPIAGQVDADRSLEATGDPRLEPGLPPLLDGQDAGPRRTRWSCCSSGSPLYVALPAGAGREDRPGRRDPLPERAGVHRPAHHRRRHGHPQGLVLQLLPGPRTA